MFQNEFPFVKTPNTNTKCEYLTMDSSGIVN